MENKGHEVVPLVRSKEKKGIFWDPVSSEASLQDLEGFDAVVHLAGKNISQRRWTSSVKKELFQSRCRDTWLLAHLLSRLKNKPKVFFSASAIGFYGDRGDELLTEKSLAGTGFLASLCQKWEEAALSLEHYGVRVVVGRFGGVLSPEGGLLQKMALPFKYGFGIRLGNGSQWMSWIAKEDLLGMIYNCLERTDIEGVVNCVSPEPIRHADFIKELASIFHRSVILPVPACLLKVVLGEMARELILSSQRVASTMKFDYKYKKLKDCFISKN